METKVSLGQDKGPVERPHEGGRSWGLGQGRDNQTGGHVWEGKLNEIEKKVEAPMLVF